jgi:glutathione S-transferase
MPLTLYGPQKTRAMRATWMLRELGIDFDHKMTPPPVDINPNQKVTVDINPNQKVFLLRCSYSCHWI